MCISVKYGSCAMPDKENFLSHQRTTLGDGIEGMTEWGWFSFHVTSMSFTAKLNWKMKWNEWKTKRKTERKTERQTERKKDRQTGRKEDRKEGRKTGRKKEKKTMSHNKMTSIFDSSKWPKMVAHKTTSLIMRQLSIAQKGRDQTDQTQGKGNPPVLPTWQTGGWVHFLPSLDSVSQGLHSLPFLCCYEAIGSFDFSSILNQAHALMYVYSEQRRKRIPHQTACALQHPSSAGLCSRRGEWRLPPSLLDSLNCLDG